MEGSKAFATDEDRKLTYNNIELHESANVSYNKRTKDQTGELFKLN